MTTLEDTIVDHRMTGGDQRGGRPLTLRRALVLSDVVALLGAWTLATAVTDAALLGTFAWWWRAAVVVGSGLVAMAALSLYRTHVVARRASANARIVRAALVSAGVALGLLGSIETRSRVSSAVIGLLLSVALLGLGRFAFETWLAMQRTRGRYRRPIIVIGNEVETASFLSFVDRSPELGYDVRGVVGPDMGAETDEVPWLGPLANAVAGVRATGATGAVVLVNGVPSAELQHLVRALTANGTHVHLSNGLLGLGCSRLEPVPVAHEPFLYVRARHATFAQRAGKRAIDIVVASVGIVLTAPVLLVAAIAIKLSDRGPVCFRQIRVGLYGKHIVVHKLRTMVVDAESRLDEVIHLNERDGPLFKASNDPRVTKVGRFLRASSIDELPQLFDVLAGRMSIVGPRPALPAEVRSFSDRLQRRLVVRPGITGLWQVEGRDKPLFQSYEELDLFYVDNWSVGFDLSIIADTVPVVAARALRGMRGKSSPVTRDGDLRNRAGEAPSSAHVGLAATMTD